MEEEDWNIDCSDDEFKDVRGPWEPSAEDIHKLYSMLERNELPELKWKSPGYKLPAPDVVEESTENIEEPTL